MSEYTKSGGEWLGAARRYVQRKCVNGDTIAWGSNEHPSPPLTMAQIEELAAEVADAAWADADQMRKTLETSRRRRLESEIRLTARVEQLEAELAKLKKEGNNQ